MEMGIAWQYILMEKDGGGPSDEVEDGKLFLLLFTCTHLGDQCSRHKVQIEAIALESKHQGSQPRPNQLF